MIRLFVAIDLPEAQRLSLSAISGGIPGAKWIRPEQLHLTLRFIGEVDNALFRDIASALGAIRAPAFELSVAGVGHWGDKRRAKVLWAGVRPSPLLLRLQSKIETALTRLGLEPERRKFHPHITLARLNGDSPNRIADFFWRNGDLALAPFVVEQFVLYSSLLGASGALHRPEAAFPLAAPLAAQPEPAETASGQ
jgi:2'-5' RNA ligase